MSADKSELAVQNAQALKMRERSLVWKVDFMLMPVLTVAFGLQFYDKAVLGSAAAFTIIEDLGLSTKTHGVVSTQRYSTATAAFYWGYIVGVLPIALLLQRLPLVKTLSVFVFIWGVVCILTVVVTSYKGLIVQRVFLGLMESSVSPGFVMITSLWYTKREQATRLGIWYGATGIFSMFSGIVNYGLGRAGGPLATWKYMYLFAGSLTIIWSFVLLFIVPDSPTRAGRWFSSDEQALLNRRLALNKTGKDQTAFKGSHVLEALRDPKIYLFMFMGAAIYICNGGVTAFGARIIKSFGYTALQAIVLQIPGGAMTVVSLWIFGFIAGRWKNSRTYLIPLSCIPVFMGALIIWKGSWVHRGLPLFGYYLLPTFGTPYVLVLALNTANVAGGTKRAISTGAIFLGYNAGNIAGAYLVFTPEAKIHYRSTWISVIVCMVFTLIASLVLRFILVRENKRRDELYGPVRAKTALDENSASGLDAVNGDGFEDLTDYEQIRFRYSL